MVKWTDKKTAMKKVFTSFIALICSFGLLQAQGWYVYDGSAIPTDSEGWNSITIPWISRSPSAMLAMLNWWK